MRAGCPHVGGDRGMKTPGQARRVRLFPRESALVTRHSSLVVREAALGLLLALPPFAVVVLLIAVPAVQTVFFTLGQVPTNNAAYSTGMHLVVSERPTLAVYRDLLGSPFF